MSVLGNKFSNKIKQKTCILSSQTFISCQGKHFIFKQTIFHYCHGSEFDTVFGIIRLTIVFRHKQNIFYYCYGRKVVRNNAFFHTMLLFKIKSYGREFDIVMANNNVCLLC